MTSHTSLRHGRECVLPENRHLSRKLTSVRDALLPIHGAKLFNALLNCVRNPSASVRQFKNALDIFLQTIPDEPQLPRYTAARRTNTNSIIDMVNLGDPAFQVTETRADARPFTLTVNSKVNIK